MEENIHNDKLDEFVNRSFESYSENPPDSLWDAIEAGLETPVIHPVKVAGFPIWKYAAGLLILLLSAALITQHLFYKEKLNQITQANIRQNKLTPTTPKAPESVLKTGGNENLLNKKDRNLSGNKADVKSGNIDSSNKGVENNKRFNNIKNAQRKSRINNNSKNIRTTENNEVIANEPIAIIKNETYKQDKLVQSPNEEILIKKEIENKPTEVLVANEKNNQSNEIEALASNKQSLVVGKDLPFSSALSVLPKAFKSGWYAGIMLAPNLTFETIESKGFPDPMHDKHTVANEQTGSVYSTDCNLRAGKYFGSHWGLESGLSYSSLTRTATNRPDFKFEDRDHGPGGPPDDNHFFNFTYELNTFGGSTSVDVRVVNSDSSYKFKDDDKLNLQVSTKETVKIIRIPVLGVYKIDFERVGIIAKAGLIANILLSNDLQITGLQTNNVLLHDDKNHPKPPVKSDSDLQLGYLFSLGAIYHLNPQLSIIAEPYYTANFPKSCTDGRPLPSHYSVGLNTGITYSF